MKYLPGGRLLFLDREEEFGNSDFMHGAGDFRKDSDAGIVAGAAREHRTLMRIASETGAPGTHGAEK